MPDCATHAAWIVLLMVCAKSCGSYIVINNDRKERYILTFSAKYLHRPQSLKKCIVSITCSGTISRKLCKKQKVIKEM